MSASDECISPLFDSRQPGPKHLAASHVPLASCLQPIILTNLRSLPILIRNQVRIHRSDRMPFTFTQEDIRVIGGVLGVEARVRGNNFRFEVKGEGPGRQVALELYPEIPIGLQSGALVSVYTPNAHLQLHFCSGYVVSEVLGEVTFVAEQGGKLAGLIVEKEGGCSMYSNVDRKLLSGDFTKLGPEVMLSGIALSLTEMILPDEDEK